MKQRKVPLRTCIISREKLPKNDLLRIVKTEDDIIFDLTGKVNGRGMYVKKDKQIIKKAINKKLIDGNLKVNITLEQIEKLKSELDLLEI